jgi:hypothetical protein
MCHHCRLLSSNNIHLFLNILNEPYPLTEMEIQKGLQPFCNPRDSNGCYSHLHFNHIYDYLASQSGSTKLHKPILTSSHREKMRGHMEHFRIQTLYQSVLSKFPKDIYCFLNFLHKCTTL